MVALSVGSAKMVVTWVLRRYQSNRSLRGHSKLLAPYIPRGTSRSRVCLCRHGLATRILRLRCGGVCTYSGFYRFLHTCRPNSLVSRMPCATAAVASRLVWIRLHMMQYRRFGCQRRFGGKNQTAPHHRHRRSSIGLAETQSTQNCSPHSCFCILCSVAAGRLPRQCLT